MATFVIDMVQKIKAAQLLKNGCVTPTQAIFFN